jgi:hypothetical protein
MEVQPNFQSSCLPRSQVPNTGEREFKFLSHACFGHPPLYSIHAVQSHSPTTQIPHARLFLARSDQYINCVLIRRPRSPPSLSSAPREMWAVDSAHRAPRECLRPQSQQIHRTAQISSSSLIFGPTHQQPRLGFIPLLSGFCSLQP